MKASHRAAPSQRVDRLGKAFLLIAGCGFISLFVHSSMPVEAASFLLLFGGLALRVSQRRA